MKERHEFWLNTLLLLVIAGLVGYLVWDVRRATENISQLRQGSKQDMESIAVRGETSFAVALYDESLFDSRDLLAPIVTPIPTPTPIPIPTPTPAPPPFAENWNVIGIIADTVQIRDYLGNMHYKKEGESLEGVKIIEVDWEKKSIRVRNEADGREKTLGIHDERLTGKRPPPPPRHR
jgi:hypothetical protein